MAKYNDRLPERVSPRSYDRQERNELAKKDEIRAAAAALDPSVIERANMHRLIDLFSYDADTHLFEKSFGTTSKAIDAHNTLLSPLNVKVTLEPLSVVSTETGTKLTDISVIAKGDTLTLRMSQEKFMKLCDAWRKDCMRKLPVSLHAEWQAMKTQWCLDGSKSCF